jgi:hypothetical protein
VELPLSRRRPGQVGGPDNWPELSRWEEGFDLSEADDVYAEVNPYAGVGSAGAVACHGQS